MKYRTEGRLSSLTRCICNAVATWREFCPEIRRKQKQSPFAAILSQPNLNEDQKKNKVFTPVCAIFIRTVEMKTKAKRFYLTILLFVVLLCDICFIVRYMFFCTVFDRHIRIKTKQIRKKVFSAYRAWGDAEFSIKGSQISMGGR